MAFQPRDNSGTLFRNDKKESDKHPDYKGDAMINGQQCWISAWIKEGKSGKFMSLSFSPKESKRSNDKRSNDRKPSRQNDDEDDEDIPF